MIRQHVVVSAQSDADGERRPPLFFFSAMRAKMACRSASGLSEREAPRRPFGLGERDEPELGERGRPFFGGGERLEERLVLRLGDLRAAGAAGAAGPSPVLSNE